MTIARGVLLAGGLLGSLSHASCTAGSSDATVTSSSARSDPPPATAPPLPSASSTASKAKSASADPPAAPGALAPNLISIGEDLVATWMEPGGGKNHRLRTSRRHEASWSAPVTIVDNDRLVASWADVPALAAAGDGALVVSWAESSGADGEAFDAMAARSTDAGASWTRIGRLHADATRAEHGFVTLVPESTGVRAFWLDGRETVRPGGTTQLRTALVTTSVEGEAVVDPSVCDCCQTAGVPTHSGAAVAYRDRTADEVRDIWFARPDGAGWKTIGAVSRDGWTVAGCPVNGPAMAARDGLLAVAWYTYAESAHRVRVAFSSDETATFGAAAEVDRPTSGRAPMGRAAVVIDKRTAIVGWMASEREAASLIVRRVGLDGSVGDEVVVGTSVAGPGAGFPRLARTERDLAVAWTEPGPPSRIRVERLPLASIPAADARTTEEKSPRDRVAVHPAAGEPAPTLAAQTLDGKRVELAQLRGQVVLLNLWATWCEPCRQEIPVLAALHSRDRGRGFTVVGLNVDRAAGGDVVSGFVTRRKIEFPIWRDVDDGMPAILGVTTYPANILVGRDGTIRWRRDGAILERDPELRAAIDEALAAR